MKPRLLITTAILIVSCGISVQAQLDLPVKVIGNTSYYYYEVQNKETLYGIANNVGVTTDDILRYNPTASQNLEKKQLLFFPVSDFHAVNRQNSGVSAQVENAFSKTDESTIQITDNKPTTYTLQAGDNIYTVAKRFNVTVEGLLQSNRTLSPSQYVEGTTVRLTPNTALPFYCETSSTKFYQYKVQDGDSFHSIARSHNTTPEALQAANPDLKKPKKGKYMIVPRTITERKLVEMRTVSVAELQNFYSSRIEEIYEQMQADRRNSEINLGIVLPFQLHKSTPPRQAMLYTDFYKGFLLAVDSVRGATGKHINLRVYDTQHNLNVTDSILQLPELQNMDMIVAPSEPQQLARINVFGQNNGVNVFNCFSTKNEDYQSNPYVYQVNAPTHIMMDRVLRWYDNQFSDYQVIFLEDGDAADKEIYDDIKKHISELGQFSTTLKVTGDLSFDVVSNHMNPGSKYVFIPSSSNKNLLKKVLKALKQAKTDRFDCDIAMLGYPEYVMYLKDYQTDLQDIDTFVFSRFFNSKGFRTRDIEALYSKWFNGSMLTSVPNMTLFGFDTGMYLLKALGERGIIDADTPLHKGIQTSFKFVRDSEGAGFVNQAIDVIHFSTDHKITTYVQ